VSTAPGRPHAVGTASHPRLSRARQLRPRRPLGGPLTRTWLRHRGFSEEVLRANRVGYDPGPRAFRRARGLPYRAPGVVFPVLGPDDRAVYVQIRYLDPTKAGRDKYDNCMSRVALNPRVVVLRTPCPDPALAEIVVVAEGIPDGLVGAELGARAAAIIGAGNHGPEVAHRLSDAFPHGRFVLPWDADHGGRKGRSVLGAQLVEFDRDVVLSAPLDGHKDLNAWWIADRDGLAAAVACFPVAMLYRPAALTVPEVHTDATPRPRDAALVPPTPRQDAPGPYGSGLGVVDA
jgi:hypothetical protein